MMTLLPRLSRLIGRSVQKTDTAPAQPRLLIVDDEPGIRAFLLRVLAPIECEVFAAANGAEAIELFEREGPIDLLIADLMMPGMNGLELGRRLHQSTPDLPILYLTGCSDALFEERPVPGATETYVDKPITAAALYEAASMALYGRLTGLRRRAVTAPKVVGSVQHTAWVSDDVFEPAADR